MAALSLVMVEAGIDANYVAALESVLLQQKLMCVVSKTPFKGSRVTVLSLFFVNPFPNSRSLGLETVNYYVYGKDSAVGTADQTVL